MARVDSAVQNLTPEVERALVSGHRRFLSYLERRLGNREAAEEVLQSAYVRTLEAVASAPRDSEGAVAWFYRLLRNALIDHQRHAAVEKRAQQKLENEEAFDQEIVNQVCACMHDLLPTIKASYAQMIEQVDLGERPLADVARAQGISVNNAMVRLHRARQALRLQLQRSCKTCAEHGCLDCSCKKPG